MAGGGVEGADVNQTARLLHWGSRNRGRRGTCGSLPHGQCEQVAHNGRMPADARRHCWLRAPDGAAWKNCCALHMRSLPVASSCAAWHAQQHVGAGHETGPSLPAWSSPPRASTAHRRQTPAVFISTQVSTRLQSVDGVQAPGRQTLQHENAFLPFHSAPQQHAAAPCTAASQCCMA